MAFGWDDAFLLAMNAAGALVSIKSAKENQDLIRQGRQLEQAAVESNLSALSAQASEASLDAIKSLRENVANQIVMNAARGGSSGAGSGQAAIQKSENTFSQDEKSRRLNLLVSQNNLRAAGVLSGIHALQSETQLGQSLTDQIFKNLPISTLTKKFGSSKKGEGAVDSIGTSIGKKFGFGLNTI